MIDKIELLFVLVGVIGIILLLAGVVFSSFGTLFNLAIKMVAISLIGTIICRFFGGSK